MTLLSRIEETLDLLRRGDPPKNRVLVLPPSMYDDPAMKKRFAGMFPGVELLRSDPIVIDPEASAGNEYWTETEENLK